MKKFKFTELEMDGQLHYILSRMYDFGEVCMRDEQFPAKNTCRRNIAAMANCLRKKIAYVLNRHKRAIFPPVRMVLMEALDSTSNAEQWWNFCRRLAEKSNRPDNRYYAAKKYIGKGQS